MKYYRQRIDGQTRLFRGGRLKLQLTVKVNEHSEIVKSVLLASLRANRAATAGPTSGAAVILAHLRTKTRFLESSLPDASKKQGSQ